jgi:hypothetical protein
MKVVVLSLLATVALSLFSLGVLNVYNSAIAQTNIMPEIDESYNTTLDDSGVGSSILFPSSPRLIAADIAQKNSLKLDYDVKNLVVSMPDKRLITQ